MTDNAILGYLLKIERKRQNKGQKEVCPGICTPSYLSKIEHGKVKADMELVKKLFERLGITIMTEEKELEDLQKLIALYYEKCEFYIENHIYEELKKRRQKLYYSSCLIDWLLIQALEGENTYWELEQCREYMSQRQRGYYALIRADYWLEKIPQKESELLDKQKRVLEESRKAYDILKNAYAYMNLAKMQYCMGNYSKVHQMESTLISLAVKEGNTFALADFYMLDGSAYACLNLEDMMMQCYERAMRLLQNTHWEKALQSVYYNIGATLISSKRYEEAMEYLERIEEPDFSTYHKKALILIRQGKISEGKNFLKKAENAVLDSSLSQSRKWKLQEAYGECEPKHLQSPEFLKLLEELIEVLEKEEHFGHIYFYKDIILETYQAQRKYKSMASFLEKLQKMQNGTKNS